MKKTLTLILSFLMIAGTFVSCQTPIIDDLQSDTSSDIIADTNNQNTDSETSKSTEDKNDKPGTNEDNKNPAPDGDNKNPSADEDNKDPATDEDNKAPEVTVKKVSFGSYPQSEVTNSTLKNTLTQKAGTLPTKANPQKWTSFKYYHKYKENDVDKTERDFMWYIDITENGQKYRGIYFTAYRPTYVLRSTSEQASYQDDNGYKTGTVYWFKYEPISWTVLSERSDGSSLLLCDSILDCKEFDYNDSDGTYNNDYSKSSIRTWLNASFLNTAFSSAEQNKILETTVDNSVSSTGHPENPNACSNTTDKIFLLSYMEAVNDLYGLELKSARIKEGTAYAYAQGLYKGTDGGNSWWLRSPSPDPIIAIFKVRGVMNTGAVDSYINANYSYRGTVPALWVKL